MAADPTYVLEDDVQRFADGSSIVRVERMGWAPWAVPGTRFRLLSTNRGTGTWSAILQLDPGITLPEQYRLADAYVTVTAGAGHCNGESLPAGSFHIQRGGQSYVIGANENGLTCYMLGLGGAILGKSATDRQLIDLDWLQDAAIAHGGTATSPPQIGESHPVVLDPAQIPWTEASLNGNWFKLLHVDRSNGLWTALMKVDPNTQTEVHHHFGEVHALVLDGDFSYEYGDIRTGDYIVEGGTIAHEPAIGPNGLTIIATFFGGLSGADDRGKPVGPFVDAQWMYEAAQANGAAGHLAAPAGHR